MANAKQAKNQAGKKAAQERHGGPKNNSPKPAKRQTSSTHGTSRKGSGQSHC